MNITPVSNAANGLNWFAEQELAWGCFHYVTIAYVVPVNCAIGLCENLTILYVLYYLKSGVGESARLYYALLAIFNICNIILLDLANGWSTTGLHFITQSRFFVSGTLYYEWFCKIYMLIFIPTDVLCMWTYVLLNIERMVAIAAPLKAKSLFTVRRNLLYVAIVGALGVVFMLYSMTVEGLVYAPVGVLGSIMCAPATQSLANMIFFGVISNISIFTLPPALSLLLGILLFVVIRRQMTDRSHLLSGASRSNVSSISSPTTGSVVVIIMAIVHSIINLPAGIIGCLYFLYDFYTVCIIQNKFWFDSFKNDY